MTTYLNDSTQLTSTAAARLRTLAEWQMPSSSELSHQNSISSPAGAFGVPATDVAPGGRVGNAGIATSAAVGRKGSPPRGTPR